MNKKFLIVLLAIFPFLSQLAVLPFVNRIDPIIFGLPFLQFWFFTGIILGPICTFAIYRIQKSEGGFE